MTLNFNIKQKRYTYSNLQIVLNNVELVSIGKKKSRIFDFWPHDFDFAPLCAVTKKIFQIEGPKIQYQNTIFFINITDT